MTLFVASSSLRLSVLLTADVGHVVGKTERTSVHQLRGRETDRYDNNQKKQCSTCRSRRGVLLRKWLHRRAQGPLDGKELRHETHVLFHMRSRCGPGNSETAGSFVPPPSLNFISWCISTIGHTLHMPTIRPTQFKPRHTSAFWSQFKTAF